mgnify:CR=1 FL=1
MTNKDLIAKVALLKQLYRKAILRQRDIYRLEKQLNDIDNDFCNVVDAICKSLRENEK